MNTNLTTVLVDETELQSSPNKTNRFSTGYIQGGDEAKGLMVERENSNEEDPWSMFQQQAEVTSKHKESLASAF